MAAEKATPVDSKTGIPLPLAPIHEDNSPTSSDINWHHHFHPRRHPLLKEAEGVSDPGLRAVRNARLQKTLKNGSHRRYHDYYSGPPLPETEEERFKTVIMAHAGYVPKFGIFTRPRRSPLIKKLTDKQRDQLWFGCQLRPGSPGFARLFINEYVLSQDLSDINESLVDEFVTSADKKRKNYLGYYMLSMAMEQAIRPIEPLYNEARQGQLINPNMPTTPSLLLWQTLGHVAQQDELIVDLRQRLTA